jgi:hypothetical protein
MVCGIGCHKSAAAGSGNPDGGTDADTDADTDTDSDSDPIGHDDVVEMCWVTTFGSPELDKVAAVTSFPDGSTAIVGSYRGSATFGAEETNETTIELTDPWTHEGFLASFEPDGSLAWARKTGAHSISGGSPFADLSPTADLGFIAVGDFHYTAVLGPGEPNETVLDASLPMEMDLMVAQYAVDGSLTWARKEGGTDTEEAGAMAMLGDGSVKDSRTRPC